MAVRVDIHGALAGVRSPSPGLRTAPGARTEVGVLKYVRSAPTGAFQMPGRGWRTGRRKKRGLAEGWSFAYVFGLFQTVPTHVPTHQTRRALPFRGGVRGIRWRAHVDGRATCVRTRFAPATCFRQRRRQQYEIRHWDRGRRAIAYWLLSAGSTWLAGILFAGAALAMLIGLVWYWIWFTQRRAAVWYLAGVTLLVGIGLLSAGSWFGTESLALWGLSVVVLPLVGLLLYGAWRLVRLLITRLFQVLLIAISQVGAAWRGELLDR
jgi:hypothetical protein